jgi:hypothetical protein
MRFAKSLLLVLLAVLAPLAAAQPSFLTQPADPTSNLPVVLIVQQYASCPPPPVIERTGFSIVVTLDGGPCLSPPTLVTQSVSLGVLPAGTYIVTFKGDTSPSGQFVVRDVNDTVRVTPSLGPSTGGTVVEVRSEVGPCTLPIGQICPMPVITFDGIAATDVTPVRSHVFRVTTPAHAPGAVEVVVRNAGGEGVNRSFAFRYYSDTEAPDSALFERRLLPVVFNGPGAFNSLWETEVAAANNSATDVRPWRAESETGTLVARKAVRLTLPEWPQGRFVFVPREFSDAVHFNVRIRDISRDATHWGAELPMPRESAFRQTIELLNVPGDSRYRRLLRVYGASSAAQNVEIQIYAMTDGFRYSWHTYRLSAGSDPADPAFHSLDLDTILPILQPGRNVAIRLASSQPVWAFVTATNRDTQQVTIVSPQ